MTRSTESFNVRVGIAKIRVWRNSRKRPGRRNYVSWEFEFTDADGHRRRRHLASKEDARAEAKQHCQRLADAPALATLENKLFGCSVTPEVAVHVYVKTREMLATIGRDDVLEAVRYFVEHHHGGVADKSIADVVKELLKVRERDGAGRRHLKDLRLHLGRFVRGVQCRLGDVTGLVIDEWLGGLDIDNRTRRNYRGSLTNLFKFVRSRNYAPASFDPMRAVPLPKVGKPKRGVFTPRELRELLAHCPDTLLPVLTLGCFAGLRQSETLLLTWKDIDWKENRVRVPEEGKTKGRWAPLHPNLRAWLEPLRNDGRVVTIKENGISKAITRLVARANRALAKAASRWQIKWPNNGPRHSYASYRCAETRNVALVADEMGHSIRELQRSYRNQKVTPEEAKEWFGLMPATDQKVLALNFG